MNDVLVIGGGISGLATAWYLRRAGIEVTVMEAQAQPGGSVRTLETEGYRVDAGPTSTLYKDGALGDLVRGLGLEGAMVSASAAAKRRYIAKSGALVPLPGNPVAFLTTPLFSLGGKLRLLAEPLHRRAPHEESIAQFVRRRLGPEFLDWAIDPFVSGVYAGDPERLSVRGATAKIYALEAEFGSLFVGAVRRWLRGRPSGPQPTGRLVSFIDGMQTLPKTIAAELGASYQGGTPVTAIAHAEPGWSVQTPQGQRRARRLVLALPAHRAAPLLAPLDAELAAPLAAIPYPPVASVALGFERTAVDHPLDGFGLLIPQRLGLEALGALFSSTLFPHRAPRDHVLVTAFIGGARNEAIAARDETELVATVLGDLRPLLGIRGAPSFQRVTLWRQAIPQYTLGHVERLAAIDARLARWPGLHLRANWRDGISLGDCVENARKLARQLSG